MHVAGIFAGAGIGPEDRVAMSLPNGLEAIVCVLAAAVAGTAAPLNPNYRHEEVCFYLEDTSAKLLVLPPEGAAEARLGAAACGVPVIVARRAGAEVEIEPQTSGKAAPPDGDRVAFVLHTSGSTGRPKRVPLRHRNVTASARHIAGAYELSPDDIAIAVMPLFHVHGLIASVLATFASGGTVVELPRFNPLSFWHTVRDHRATWYSAVPAIHQVLLTRARGRRPAGTESLRFIRSASAPLPAATLRELGKIFEIPVVEAYGMTEAAHQIASNRLPADERKLGSVGKGTGVRIGILDSEGALLGAGEP